MTGAFLENRSSLSEPGPPVIADTRGSSCLFLQTVKLGGTASEALLVPIG